MDREYLGFPQERFFLVSQPIKGHPMGTLRVVLFGGVRISYSEQPPMKHMTRSGQSLLAYLLLHRQRFHPREVLAGVFWGDQSEERARSCLSTALWRLRTVLESNGIPKGTYLVATPLAEIGFNRASDYWLDAEAFEEKVRRGLSRGTEVMTASDAEQLQEALALYTGELLEGFYEDWALRERERLRVLHTKCLVRLMCYWKERGDYDQALACGQSVLDDDPLQEEIHREVMRIYLEKGQRGHALRQFRVCCAILEDELGIAPMDETRRLCDEILAAANFPARGALPLQPANDTSGDPALRCEREGKLRGHQTINWASGGVGREGGDLHCLAQALNRLQRAMEGFERSREELERARHLIESLTQFPETL
jgi:DNA-binding SARP family transcriptional activator